mmetsp:Transcript_1833/g.3876  ORF Transcript_1833/g.3876 Transcript_1833/m.3876 type:complete len:216 (+) Transcript_1833:278-925(+)
MMMIHGRQKIRVMKKWEDPPRRPHFKASVKGRRVGMMANLGAILCAIQLRSIYSTDLFWCCSPPSLAIGFHVIDGLHQFDGGSHFATQRSSVIRGSLHVDGMAHVQCQGFQFLFRRLGRFAHMCDNHIAEQVWIGTFAGIIEATSRHTLKDGISRHGLSGARLDKQVVGFGTQGGAPIFNKVINGGSKFGRQLHRGPFTIGFARLVIVGAMFDHP